LNVAGAAVALRRQSACAGRAPRGVVQRFAPALENIRMNIDGKAPTSTEGRRTGGDSP